MRRHWLRAPVLAAAAGTLVAGLSAAPSLASTPTNASSSATGTLTISNETGSLWTCSFNPLAPTSMRDEAFGFVYEPLVYMNALQSGKTTPMLASSYKWGAGNKVLTFTIRKGVKWNDGQPFSAADVAFTFNMLKKNPALDLYSVWSVLKSVSQQGNNVVFTFKTTAVPYFFYIADKVPIVPQHIWASIKNPVTFVDPNPVGTGPYTVSKCTGQNITYTANPGYWQPGLPKVKTLLYPAFTSNDPANVYLATGQAQWGGQFIPNQKVFYLAKSKDNHFWYPGIANVYLFINLKESPLNDVAVRQAMAYAINRQRVAQIGEYGYEPASNQTGIVTPVFSSWLDKSLAAKYNYSYNPKKAISLLEKAGYKKGSNGIFAKNGQALSFSVINVGGNSDWVASVQVIQQELAAVGIKITARNLTGNAYDTALYDGKFQLAYGREIGGPSPYYELRALLYGPNTAPIGQTAVSNYDRYSNPTIDKLIDQYAGTTSAAVQHSIVNQLQRVMLTDVPAIPTTQSVDWFQYNTATFSGWPTPSNPYAEPAPYNTPDVEQVLLHLVPKG